MSRASEIADRNERERANTVATTGCPRCFALPAEECRRDRLGRDGRGRGEVRIPHLQRIARFRADLERREAEIGATSWLS